MSRAEGSSSVKSATRTLDILEFVTAGGRPVSAAEIAAALAIPISSLSYLLGTLVERGYLLRDGRLLAPGPALARLAPQGGAIALADRVRPLLRTLSLQLNESASFFVRHGTEMEAIASEVSAQPLRYTVEIGRPLPLHAFASGKAILAALDDAELSAYLRESRRTAFTPLTKIDEAALREDLAAIRAGGIARTASEYTPGIVGIGRAVTGTGGELIGAFSIAIPEARTSPELEARAAALLQKTAQALAGV